MAQEIWEKTPEISHYTNSEAAISILNNQELWLTFYRNTNDQSELRGSYEIIKKHIRSNEPNDLHKQLSRKLKNVQEFSSKKSISRTLGKMYDALENSYICSFCQHITEHQVKSGILSQWRYYGKNGCFIESA